MQRLKCFLIGMGVSVIGITLIITNAGASFYPQRSSVQLHIPEGETSVRGMDLAQLDCLAQNVFFEARGEPAKGKAMVAAVTIERTRSGHFPTTICGVVHQAMTDDNGKIIKNKCAFSWYCSGTEMSLEADIANPTTREEWKQSYTIAKLTMLGFEKMPVDMDGVTHYHAKSVKPYWAKSKNYKLVARIGDHLFYRWKSATLMKWEPKPQVAMN